jgi:signal transduction histidine kinase
VSLVAGGRTFGTLSVARRVGRLPFTALDLEVVGSFATQASVILENDQVRRELQRLAMSEDQERIARDLHDTVIQRLFATGLSLQATVRAITDPWALSRIAGAVEDLDATIRQIRSVIFGLEELKGEPGPAVRAGVLGVVREAARTLGYEPNLAFDGPLDTVVDEALAADLQATLREALSNVARHAGAGRVEVAVRAVGGALRLTVTDDGRGPGPGRVGGRGVANMCERAERHDGSLVVEQAPGGGTRLIWTVPLTGE